MWEWVQVGLFLSTPSNDVNSVENLTIHKYKAVRTGRFGGLPIIIGTASTFQDAFQTGPVGWTKLLFFERN